MALNKVDTETISTTGTANTDASSRTQSALQNIERLINEATSQQSNEFNDAVQTAWKNVKPKFDDLTGILDKDGKAICSQADQINEGFQKAQTGWIE